MFLSLIPLYQVLTFPGLLLEFDCPIRNVIREVFGVTVTRKFFRILSRPPLYQRLTILGQISNCRYWFRSDFVFFFVHGWHIPDSDG